MNRSSSLLFYKLVSAAIVAGVIASFIGLARVYRTPATDATVMPPAGHAAVPTAAPHTAEAS